MDRPTVLVVAAGAPAEGLRAAPAAQIVIAADEGLDAARRADRDVDHLVGDLDSVSPDALRRAEAGRVTVHRHRADKDESDLELALDLAVDIGAGVIHVVTADGGRLDHQLANLLVLASPRWSSARVEARVGEHRVWVVRGRRVLPLEPGDPLALHAIGGPAGGVVTEGLRYPLADEVLAPMVARGIANEVTAPSPVVSVREGVLLAISSPMPTSDRAGAR